MYIPDDPKLIYGYIKYMVLKFDNPKSRLSVSQLANKKAKEPPYILIENNSSLVTIFRKEGALQFKCFIVSNPQSDDTKNQRRFTSDIDKFSKEFYSFEVFYPYIILYVDPGFMKYMVEYHISTKKNNISGSNDSYRETLQRFFFP